MDIQTQPRNADLRYATGKERRYALAYLRSLAGGDERRQGDPKGHPEYALTEERENRIRADIEGMVLDAHPQLVRRMRESLAQREE